MDWALCNQGRHQPCVPAKSQASARPLGTTSTRTGRCFERGSWKNHAIEECSQRSGRPGKKNWQHTGVKTRSESALVAVTVRHVDDFLCSLDEEETRSEARKIISAGGCGESDHFMPCGRREDRTPEGLGIPSVPERVRR